MPSTPNAAVWFPGPDDEPDGPTQLENLAMSIDDSLVPAFGSAGIRDATITAPTVGMMCTVAGIPMVYLGAWVLLTPNICLDLSITSNFAVLDSTWTAVALSGSPLYAAGTGLAATTTGPSGIVIGVGGRYVCSGSLQFTPNDTGMRGISIGVSASPYQDLRPAVGGNLSTSVTFSQEIAFVAGQVASLWAYQSSGANINVINNRHLCLRRVG